MDHPDAAGPESERGRRWVRMPGRLDCCADITKPSRWSKFVEMSTPKPLNETHGNLLAGLQAPRKAHVVASFYPTCPAGWKRPGLFCIFSLSV